MPATVRPTRKLLWAVLFAALPAAMAPLSCVFGYIAVGLDLALLATLGLDWWLHRNRDIEARLRMPARAGRLTPFETVVEIDNRGARACEVVWTQHHPEHIEPRDASRVAVLPPGATMRHATLTTASKRGAYTLEAPVVEFDTPLKLGRQTLWTDAAYALQVLPSTRALGRFDTLVRQQKLHHMGIVKVRQRGSGNEIAGLRPYAPGDPPGRIDWKATARKGVPISREMHAQRRQNLILVLDCGRRMAREVQGRSRLDDAVEAAMLLGHVALRFDDRVGLSAFADTELCVVPPVRGSGGAGVLARALFDLHPRLCEPAYETMAGRVHARFSKRSLMVLFTDAVEPESLAGLAKPVRFLSTHHLVLCVTFKDAAVADAIRHVGDDDESFFRAGAAADLFVERERNLARLRQAGAMVLEAEAGKLSSDVINRYLEIKARQLL